MIKIFTVPQYVEDFVLSYKDETLLTIKKAFVKWRISIFDINEDCFEICYLKDDAKFSDDREKINEIINSISEDEKLKIAYTEIGNKTNCFEFYDGDVYGFFDRKSIEFAVKYEDYDKYYRETEDERDKIKTLNDALKISAPELFNPNFEVLNNLSPEEMNELKNNLAEYLKYLKKEYCVSVKE